MFIIFEISRPFVLHPYFQRTGAGWVMAAGFFLIGHYPMRYDEFLNWLLNGDSES